MTEFVTVTDEGPVRTVRMNRPEKKNALTLVMYDAMAAAIEDAGANPALHCLLIAGAPTAFCAGNDIGEFLKAASGGAGLGEPSMRFLYALARCEMPLVAAVQGNAVGVGTTMLLHCDHVVAADNARFATPFVGLGLVPEAASSLIAPRLIIDSEAEGHPFIIKGGSAMAAFSCFFNLSSSCRSAPSRFNLTGGPIYRYRRSPPCSIAPG